MTRLVWDALSEREVRYGIDRGVVYPRDEPPVVWNGLVSLQESPEDADHSTAYFDGQRYTQRRTPEGFAGSVEAFTYPEVLDRSDEFDLSFRALSNQQYVIHLIYNAQLVSTQLDYETINSEVDTSTFQWNMTTVPERIPNIGSTAHVIIDAYDTRPDTLELIEELLYGTDATQPRIPHLPELIDIFDAGAIFIVVDNGDGTWTATGPDEMIEMLDSTTFRIVSPSAIYINPTTYTLSSW